MTEETKEPLIGKTLEELRTLARDLGMPAFVGGQIARWLYVQHVKDINEMANISKKHRELLAQRFTVGCHAPIDAQYSKDGTIKYLFPVYAGASKEKLRHEFVETVYIPDGDRATLCVSSQVGCKMNCLFCQTGKQGFEGSLTAADILNQVYALPDVDKLTNIVFMGQGEPMDNLDNVLRATEILTADYGWAWSPKRITVSSVGVRKKLRRFLDESDCHVAISLHSPIPEQRAQLMPAERGMSIEEVVKLLREYDFTHQRRLSFEYILFGGLNDTPTHARAIVILSDKPYASGHDLNARPQLVIEASTKDSARILRDLLAFEEQESYAFLQHNHHPKMEEKIRRQFGVQMKVPEAMRASKTSKDFLWIATNGAENLRSLCVLRLPDSPKADWARAIDQMLSQHIHGDQASSSMHLALATVQTHQERGIHLLTGQWMMEGDAMGGPFVASVKKTRQGALVLLAFAYAPEREKRNIMRQLRTVVFNEYISYGE